MKMRKSVESKKSHQGVEKPTHRDKKDQERLVGHGPRLHEKRFEKEYLAVVDANRQEKFIEKVKASEKHSPKTHE